MDRRRALLIAGMVIAVGAIIYGGKVLFSGDDLVADSDGVILQFQAERVWAGEVVDFTEFDAELNEQLYRPEILKLYNDQLYIADNGDLHVKRFDLNGELIATIGNGEGEGPGELRYIADFSVREKRVWIADHRARAVHGFRTDGTFLSRFHPEGIPLRITGAKDGFIVLRLMSPQPFHLFNFEGNELAAKGDTLSSLVSNPLGLDGRFVDIGSDRTLFVVRLSGFMAFLDSDGTVDRIVETIDRPTMRELTQDVPQSSQVVARPPKMNVSVEDVCVDSDALYLLSYFEEDREEAHSVLDRYDLSSGQYESSIRLPFPVGMAQVHGDRIFVVRDAQLYVSQIVYKRPDN